MKKNLLSLSIATLIGGLGLAGAANAGVSLDGNDVAGQLTPTTATRLAFSNTGVGHIVLVPYFSTQNGNATLLSLTNTDIVNGKAVKVRFRGAANSDDIFDFQVFLSPGDVWTANISQGADGRSRLVTTDRSCTLPANVNQSFVLDRLPATFSAADRAAQTREGYIEIFNMADVRPGTALFTATKHVNGVAPCGSNAAGLAALNALLVDPANETAAFNLGFDTPTTGLTGGWTIINTAGASVAWSAKASALLAADAAGAPARGRLVFSPQTSEVVAGTVINNLTNDPLLRNPLSAVALTSRVIAANFDLPDLSTPYTGVGPINEVSPSLQANQVSGSFAVANVVNEYLTDTTIAASTDWTFSSPTRRYAVALDYSATPFNVIFSTAVDTGAAGAVGNAVDSLYYTPANTSRGTGANANLICVFPSPLGQNITSFDREEQTPIGGFVISPGTATRLQLCGETSVLSFNAGGVAAASVLGATIARTDIDATYRDGWANIPTTGIGNGLPILGHAFFRATGPTVAGRSTNFGITYEHSNR